MYMFDGRISIEKKELLEKYLHGYKYMTSGLCFTSLYMWRNDNQWSFKEIGDYLCIAGVSYLEGDDEAAFMFPPLTKTGGYNPASLRKTILEAKEIFEEKGQTFSIRLLPVHMVGIFREACPEMNFESDRANFDYIYEKNALIELKGKKYHSKKNHLNYFKKNNSGYSYEKMTSAMTDEAMDFIAKFNSRKDVSEYEMNLLEMEGEAMRDVFRNIETVGYEAGIIRIDGEITALTVAGKLDDETMVVHVEKADTFYRGSYQAINYEFCKNTGSDIIYINREEDMALENLRKAKMSYKPTILLEKCIASF